MVSSLLGKGRTLRCSSSRLLQKWEWPAMTTEATTHRKESTPPTAFLMGAHFFALMFYVMAASAGWVEPGVDDVDGAAGGGAFIRFIFAASLLLLSFLANLLLFVWTVIRRYRQAHWYFAWRAWPIIVCAWRLAVTYDFSRHGIQTMGKIRIEAFRAGINTLSFTNNASTSPVS